MADFNLKLTIQKLEEELSLYRNGLDGQQLLEMIMEKEEIIKQKDAQIQEEADKVVILYDKYKELASVKEDLDAENIKLLDELQQSQFLLSRRDGSLDDHEMTIKSLNETVFSLQDENKRLKEEIEDNRNVIAKLQERCGSVVKEKADINRKFKTEKAQFDDKITRYKREIERGIQGNEELKSLIAVKRPRISNDPDDTNRLVSLNKNENSLTSKSLGSFTGRLAY